MRGAPRLSVFVRGDLACFSRPEFKTERVSYPWITPSAARGIYEAILWKPAIRWEVRRISVLRPINFISFRRNEVSKKISPTSAKPERAFQFTDDDRAQRNTVALKNVAYLLEAEIALTEKGQKDGEKIIKFIEMFERRLKQGQCFSMPYLGCREFVATVEEPKGGEKPIEVSMKHGLMFYDMCYSSKKMESNTPLFYKAFLENGVVEVPSKADVLGEVS